MMPKFRVAGLTYNYIQTGQGSPLLLLHGFTGSAENWVPLMRALADDYQLLAVDLPGHGESEAPTIPARYAMSAVARDIDALLNYLQLSRVHLIGYSMGGRLALYLALHQPERWRSLILESASPGLATDAERTARVSRDEALATFIEREGVEAFVTHWETLPLFASQRRLPVSVQQTHRERRLRNRRHGLAASLRGMGTGVQPSLWERLPELVLPVLLIAGRLDKKFVAIAQEMAARIPRAHVAIVPDAGHTVHLEQPVGYEELLRAWLPEVDG